MTENRPAIPLFERLALAVVLLLAYGVVVLVVLQTFQQHERSGQSAVPAVGLGVFGVFVGLFAYGTLLFVFLPMAIVSVFGAMLRPWTRFSYAILSGVLALTISSALAVGFIALLMRNT